MNNVSPVAKYALCNNNFQENLQSMNEEKYIDHELLLRQKKYIFDSLVQMNQENDEQICSDINSDICRALSNYADYTTKKTNYVVNKRFSEIENIQENIEDIDYSTFKNFRTLPAKYSNDNDIRNNIIFNNNNIYIYAENKNGTLNEQACISISPNNNMIYCSTRGRRYTIGGDAGIQKNVNNEYNFFDEINNTASSLHDTIKTYTFDAIDSSEISSTFTKMNLIKTNDILDDSNINKLNTGNIFNEHIIMNSCDSNNLNTTKCISKNLSVQKLFKYYKKCSQDLEHEQRVCKPCAHVYNGNICMNGDDCSFCHHPDHVLISAKKWKKLVKNNMEKLDILLHVLRNPDDVNSKLLNEMLKHNPKNFKASKKINNSTNNTMLNINTCNNNNMMDVSNINNINDFGSLRNGGNGNINRKNKNNNKNKGYNFHNKNATKMIKPTYNYYDSNEIPDPFKNKFHIRNNNNMNIERNYNFVPYHANM
ncbi:conserved Plasmodium protein, unknown function [Plasmodium chabaudi adami]|uniref:C3H1-type domain-containing protein n=1 Tax=Plasmodium chabaudi adami TaxID=5826 RepID=A0A1C6YPG6_PLACE|nr:conserved Plasmodium protein, unknown function [Plasmodium chabaudi adami]